MRRGTTTIVRAECDYRAPAHFGDELDVRLNVSEIGRSSFSLVYEIAHAVTGGLVATGKTVIVGYDYAAGQDGAARLRVE